MTNSSPDSDEPRRPLHGVRILDFTRVLSGPYCTAILGDIGAEVIKVEPPHGDDYREIGPFRDGHSALFLLCNRNKKSISLDLKTDEGRKLAVDLSRKCDVVVENFKPGVADRLGIGFETLSKANPGLVYASISGFGQSGTLSDRPAFDLIAQAMSGLMDVTGEEDGSPLKVGESFGDLCAGLFASWAILAALLGKAKTGRGTHVDVAMFDSLFSLLPTAIAQSKFAGIHPSRIGNRHPLTTPFGVFDVRDGQIVIAVITNAQFRNLTEALNCPEVYENPIFATDELRTRHEPQMRRIIEDQLSHMDAEEAIDLLTRHKVPASPIWSMEQAIKSTQVAERSLLPEQIHPLLGSITGMEQPVHFHNMARGDQAPAPALGQHGSEILSSVLGLSPDEIEQLSKNGAIGKGM